MATGGALQGLVAAVLGLAAGVILGGIGPRSEVRDLREQLASAEECADKPSELGRQFAEALSGKPWEGALDDDERRNLEQAVQERKQSDAAGTEDDVPEEADEEAFDPDDFDPEDPEDVERGLDFAKTGMALRSAQARQALDEQAGLSEEQWVEFDAAVDDMNADLQDITAQFVDTLADGGEPTRRDAMIFGADVLDVFLEADDRIYGLLDADQRSAAEAEAMDPMAHMDPALLDLFVELER